MILGGLINETEGDNTNRVPFFGDLPGMGWLFKRNTTSTVKENLMIFLTVLIDRGPRDAYEIYKAHQGYEADKHSPVERLFPEAPSRLETGWYRTDEGSYRFGASEVPLLP